MQFRNINPIENILLKFKRDIEHQSVNTHSQNDLLAAVRHGLENIEPACFKDLISTILAKLNNDW